MLFAQFLAQVSHNLLEYLFRCQRVGLDIKVCMSPGMIKSSLLFRPI